MWPSESPDRHYSPRGSKVRGRGCQNKSNACRRDIVWDTEADSGNNLPPHVIELIKETDTLEDLEDRFLGQGVSVYKIMLNYYVTHFG